MKFIRPQLTPRDKFALAAPQEVPMWFAHRLEPRPQTPVVPQIPHGGLPYGLSPRDAVDAWKRSPEGKAQFDAYDTALRAVTEWTRADNLSRLAQWRWAWADAMLREREPRHSPTTDFDILDNPELP